MNIMEYVRNPFRVVYPLNRRGLLNWLPDKMYLDLLYRACQGKKLQLKQPKTYSEKLQWLKLYDRRPEYTTMVDKYEAKKHIAGVIGEEYIVPTIGLWDRFEDIDFDKLPDKFVLKCTHDSGGLIICKDKANLDIKAARKKICKSLKKNYFYQGREWPYKNVKPRIICEPLLEDDTKSGLSDYKFYCFDGCVRMLHITFGRGTAEGLSMNYYDRDLNLLPVGHYKYPNYKGEFIPPTQYEKMVELASKLSEGIPHVRVDFYEVNGKIYAGELTFFTDSGVAFFNPREFDETVGKWLALPMENGDKQKV